MSTQPNDFKIGLFVIGGAGILIAATLLFGASKVFEGKMVHETYVQTVEGLNVGAPVMLRGVPVGEVTRVNFTWNVYRRAEPRFALVEFTVRNDAWLSPTSPHTIARQAQKEIQQGLRARVKSQGLVGASIVSLEYVNPAEYPPLNVPWQPKHIYIPSAPGQFSEIISALEKTSDQLKRLDLQSLADSLQTSLQGTRTLIDRLNQVDYAKIGGDADAVLVQLRETSAHLSDFIGRSTPDQPVTSLGEITDSTERTLAELKTTVGKIDALLTQFDVSSLNRTIENVRRASAEFEEAAHRFKQYPSGVLFGQPPARAASVEAPRP